MKYFYSLLLTNVVDIFIIILRYFDALNLIISGLCRFFMVFIIISPLFFVLNGKFVFVVVISVGFFASLWVFCMIILFNHCIIYLKVVHYYLFCVLILFLVSPLFLIYFWESFTSFHLIPGL